LLPICEQVISIVLNENILHNLRNHLCQTNTVREHDANNINTIKDNLSSDEDSVHITSGSFGEGLEMKGSDIDLMYVISCVRVYEDINKVRFNYWETSFVEIKEGHVIIVSLFLSCS
jgi:hypothetical protein